MRIGETPNYFANQALSIDKERNASLSGEAGVRPQIEDRLTLSENSRLASSILKGGLSSVFGFEPKTPGRITDQEILEHAQEFLKGLNHRLQDLFSEKGIRMDVEIRLGHEYGTGDVIVTSDHPHKEKIEALFKEVPGMRNEFTKITSMLEIAEAGKEAAKFQKAYTENARQAVSRYGYLFDSHLEAFLSIADGHADVTLKRVPNA
jgi:hypothetical protein